MRRYYFEGWIDVDDYYDDIAEDVFKADLQNDIIETLGYIVDGEYSVKITKSEELEDKDK